MCPALTAEEVKWSALQVIFLLTTNHQGEKAAMLGRMLCSYVGYQVRHSDCYGINKIFMKLLLGRCKGNCNTQRQRQSRGPQDKGLSTPRGRKPPNTNNRVSHFQYNNNANYYEKINSLCQCLEGWQKKSMLERSLTLESRMLEQLPLKTVPPFNC